MTRSDDLASAARRRELDHTRRPHYVAWNGSTSRCAYSLRSLRYRALIVIDRRPRVAVSESCKLVMFNLKIFASNRIALCGRNAISERDLRVPALSQREREAIYRLRRVQSDRIAPNIVLLWGERYCARIAASYDSSAHRQAVTRISSTATDLLGTCRRFSAVVTLACESPTQFACCVPAGPAR